MATAKSHAQKIVDAEDRRIAVQHELIGLIRAARDDGHDDDAIAAEVDKIRAAAETKK